MSEPSVARQLFRLAVPIIGLNVLAVITLAVDSAMCGHLDDGQLALTALGFGTQVVFLLMVAMMGLTIGTASLVARAHGAGDMARVNHLFRQSHTLTLSVAAAVALLGNVFGDLLLQGLGAEPQVRVVALEYLRPLLTGSVFYYLSILHGAVLRGVGNTQIPFRIALLTNAVNVALNYGLILGNFGLPELGVQGAAIGTVVSYAVGVVLMVFVLRRDVIPELRAPVIPCHVDGALIAQLWRVGWPSALDFVILNAAFIALIGMIGRLEQVAVAAHGIGLRIQALAFVPGLAVSHATAALVGQALGANDPSRARAVTRASLVLCTAMMSAIAVVIWLSAYPIVGIFHVEAGSRLETLAVMWIRLLGYCMPFVGAYIAFGGAFNGSGATRMSLSINAIVTIIFQIPLSAVFGFTLGWGPFGVWVAFPAGFIVKAAAGAILYRRGTWARIGLTA